MATTTSTRTSKTVRFWLPVAPVPASRPRVSRWGGVGYGKRYTAWRKAAAAFPRWPQLRKAFQGPVQVAIECHVERPRTSRREWPRGDVDNYAKGVLDAITQHAGIWQDDDQVIHLVVKKRWAGKDGPGIAITIREVQP